MGALAWFLLRHGDWLTWGLLVAGALLAPRLLPRWRSRTGRLVSRGACALGVGLASFLVGAWSMALAAREAAARLGPEAPVCWEGAPGWGGVLAAASPFHRADALLHRFRLSRRQCAQDERQVRELMRLAPYDASCGERAHALYDTHQYEAVIREGWMCHSSYVREKVGLAWMAQGEWERASELLSGGDTLHAPANIVAPLLARDLARAAEGARALAKWSRSLPDGEVLEAELECVALSLDARAGRDGASQALEGRLQGPGGVGCTLLLADLRDGPTRLALLAPLLARPPGQEDVGWRRRLELACLLALETDPAHGCWGPMGSEGGGRWRDLFDHAYFGWDRSIEAGYGLKEAILRRLASREDVLDVRISFGADLARLDSMAGAHAEARARMERVLADLRRLEGEGTVDVSHPLEHALAMVVEVDMRAGAPDRMDAVLPADSREVVHEQLRALRSFNQGAPVSVLRDSRWIQRDINGRNAAQWNALATGDGAEVVRVLEREPPYERTAVLLGAPRVQRNREVLVAWVDGGDRQPGRPGSLLDTLIDQGNRALLLRRLGRPELAAPREQAALRFREALLRRELSVPLFFLGG